MFHENRLLADLIFVENWEMSSAAVVIGALRFKHLF